MISDKPSESPVIKLKPYKRKTDSKKYTAICLTVIGIFLIGSGIALIIVGIEHDIPDLFILGPIFLVAGIGFTVLMFYIIVTQIYEKRASKKPRQVNKKEKKAQEKISKQIDNDINSVVVLPEPKPYIEDIESKLKETQSVQQLRSPTQRQLYGITPVKPDDGQLPGTVEIIQEPVVQSTYKNNDILEDKTKSTPSKDALYGEPVKFSLSGSPTPPPVTSHSSASPTFSADLRPVGESPVPSVISYTLPNEVPEESMSQSASPVPPANVYTLPNDDNTEIESSHL